MDSFESVRDFSYAQLGTSGSERDLFRGLEKADYDDDDDDDRKSVSSLPPRPPPRRRLMVCLIGLVILITTLDLWLFVTPSGYLKSTAAPRPDIQLEDLVERPFRRPDAEYILDPAWDVMAAKQVRYHNWTIVEKEGNPDGVFKRMVMINGQFPGPLIAANEGDTVVVDVLNLGSLPTAIHWHGIFQNGTNFLDGAPGVTQCPIAPGQSFRYTFTVEGQSGSYFYHGHQGAQRLDGLIGPIVIHSRSEAQDAFQFASDRVVFLQDWYYDPGEEILQRVLSPHSMSSPLPNGALINGMNQVDCQLHPSRRCDSTGIPLPAMHLGRDRVHRMRFINAGAFAWFHVSIDQHFGLAVIEVDGTRVETQPVPDLVLAPGQRYSIMLTTKSDRSDAVVRDLFWLRAKMIKECFAEPRVAENGSEEASVIIQYMNDMNPLLSSANLTSQLMAPMTTNTAISYPTTCRDMAPSTKLKPYPPLQAPEYADHSWYLHVTHEMKAGRPMRGFINSSSYRPNLAEPTLHRLIDGLTASNASFDVTGVNAAAFRPASELVVSHDRVETVDIVLQNLDDENHPFHLHGVQAWVLGAGPGPFPGYGPLGLRPDGRGLLDPANASIVANPLRRDTATVEAYGWLLLRFVADNPGVWLFHCHMLWHHEAGMAMQFVSRLDQLRRWRVPDENRRLCDALAISSYR